MGKLVDKGYTTFDLADHYGPAEDFVGEFETLHRSQASKGQVRGGASSGTENDVYLSRSGI